MRQIQEFSIWNYEVSISVPKDAIGVAVVYSPAMKNIVVCFDFDAAVTYLMVMRRFKAFMSWEDIPVNAKYCGSAYKPNAPQFSGAPEETLYHVYEII